MIYEENPVKQPTAHCSPTHRSQAHISPIHSSSVHSKLFYIPQWMRPTGFQSPKNNTIKLERDGDDKQADKFKVERYNPTKGTEPIAKKAVTRTTLAMQAVEEPMAEPDDEREDCSDEDSNEVEKPAAEAAPTQQHEVTDKNGESSSEDHITEDIDVWKASKPTKPNPTAATTTPKLNSKKTSTKPGTRRPTPRLGIRKPAQDLTQDNRHKTWHKKTSTDLAQEADQTDKKPSNKANEDEEDDENKAEWKDRQSDKPAAKSPTNDGGDVNTSEEEIDEPNDEPAKMTPMHEEEVPDVTTDAEETIVDDTE
jgi:hypothetical protein